MTFSLDNTYGRRIRLGGKDKPLLRRIVFISYQSECVVWKSKHQEIKLDPVIVVHHGVVQTGGEGVEGGGLHLVGAGPGCTARHLLHNPECEQDLNFDLSALCTVARVTRKTKGAQDTRGMRSRTQDRTRTC